MLKQLTIILLLAVTLTACHDDEPATAVQPDRTVIVYMAAENNLSVYAWKNLQAMKEGSRSLTDRQCLLVYVDRSHPGELPYLARLSNGQVTDSMSIADMNISTTDEYASDPHVFEDVLRYAVDHYTASQDYGLVLWGHSSGWFMEDSLLYTRGFGFDNGHNDRTTPTGYWLNIPTMSRVLKRLPVKWSFLMADCCHFACLETAYELRGAVDYIVGSAAEIPGRGAPYDKIAADLFLPAETACRSIADKYYSDLGEAQPLVVIKTDEMEQLASATRTALLSVADSLHRRGLSYPNMDGIIHYLYFNDIVLQYDQSNSVFYDAGDFIRHYAPTSVYTAWRQSLDRAVVYRLMATRWLTQMAWGLYYSDFKLTTESYHGVSMFVPQNPHAGNYARLNRDIRNMEWYAAVGLDCLINVH